MGVFPGNRQMGMAKAFLYVERVCASLQEKCCVGVTQGVKIEKWHIQLLMNDAIRMLQGARLDESSVFASVHQMDWLAAGAKVAIFIDADLVIALSVVISCLFLPIVLIH